MSNKRFVRLEYGKCMDTYNDVVMDFDDCIRMLNVAETIISGALISSIIERMENE